jgi:hypothetical protein
MSEVKYSQVTQSYTQRPLSMALTYPLVSLPICNFSRVPHPCKDPISLVTYRKGIVPRPVQCMSASKISNSPNISRRSANYQPSIWNYDYIQSLKNEYVVHTFCYCFHLIALILLVLLTITRTD